MTTEIWRTVIGYNGYYEVSNLGRVKSLTRKIKAAHFSKRTIKERILEQTITDKGYHTVSLCKNGRSNYRKVHRLVAEAFIPIPDNLKEYKLLHVCHNDGNKSNNTVDNLRWDTPSNNIQDNYADVYLTVAEVQHINDELDKGYLSDDELAEDVGLRERDIKMIRRVRPEPDKIRKIFKKCKKVSNVRNDDYDE